MKIGIVERIMGRRRVAAVADPVQCNQGMDLMSSPEAEASGERFDEPFPSDERAGEHAEEAGDRNTPAESTQQPTPKVWRHSVGQAEFILQPMSDSLARVIHRDQVGYIGINQNWDVGEPYSWTFMDRGDRARRRRHMKLTAKPDGIHGSPFGEAYAGGSAEPCCAMLLLQYAKERGLAAGQSRGAQAGRAKGSEGVYGRASGLGGRLRQCRLPTRRRYARRQRQITRQDVHRCHRFAEDLDGYFAPDAPDWQEADELKGMTLGGRLEFFRIEYWPARVAPSEKSGMIYMTVHYFY